MAELRPAQQAPRRPLPAHDRARLVGGADPSIGVVQWGVVFATPAGAVQLPDATALNGVM